MAAGVSRNRGIGRHGRPLTRYFPELVAAFARLDAERWTMDGEVLVTVDGRFEFEDERTAECVVAGLRARADPPEVWSLLLGLCRIEQLDTSAPDVVSVLAA